MTSIRNATKTKAETEDQSAERLIRKDPTKKPPRKDLRKNRIVEEDPDLQGLNRGDKGDPDLSRRDRKMAFSERLDVVESTLIRFASFVLLGEKSTKKKKGPSVDNTINEDVKRKVRSLSFDKLKDKKYINPKTRREVKFYTAYSAKIPQALADYKRTHNTLLTYYKSKMLDEQQETVLRDVAKGKNLIELNESEKKDLVDAIKTFVDVRAEVERESLLEENQQRKKEKQEKKRDRHEKEDVSQEEAPPKVKKELKKRLEEELPDEAKALINVNVLPKLTRQEASQLLSFAESIEEQEEKPSAPKKQPKEKPSAPKKQPKEKPSREEPSREEPPKEKPSREEPPESSDESNPFLDTEVTIPNPIASFGEPPSGSLRKMHFDVLKKEMRDRIKVLLEEDDDGDYGGFGRGRGRGRGFGGDSDSLGEEFDKDIIGLQNQLNDPNASEGQKENAYEALSVYNETVLLAGKKPLKGFHPVPKHLLKIQKEEGSPAIRNVINSISKKEPSAQKIEEEISASFGELSNSEFIEALGGDRGAYSDMLSVFDDDFCYPSSSGEESECSKPTDEELKEMRDNITMAFTDNLTLGLMIEDSKKEVKEKHKKTKTKTKGKNKGRDEEEGEYYSAMIEGDMSEDYESILLSPGSKKTRQNTREKNLDRLHDQGYGTPESRRHMRELKKHKGKPDEGRYRDALDDFMESYESDNGWDSLFSDEASF